MAKRYWEDTAERLEALSAATGGSSRKRSMLIRASFAMSLEAENRMCLAGFMAAEYDDLPDAVKIEVQTFADINVAWLARMLAVAFPHEGGHVESGLGRSSRLSAERRLMARSRADLALFDALIESFASLAYFPA